MIRWPLAVKSLCDGHVINYRWAEGAHVDLIDHATGRRIESSAAPATGAARIPRFVSIQPRPSTGSSSSAPYCPRVPKATTEFVKKVLSPHSNAVDDKRPSTDASRMRPDWGQTCRRLGPLELFSFDVEIGRLQAALDCRKLGRRAGRAAYASAPDFQ